MAQSKPDERTQALGGPSAQTRTAAWRSRRPERGVYRGERTVSFFMLAPVVALLLGLVIGPIVFVVDASLHRYNLFQVTEPRYVGLENFYYLFQSETYQTSLLRSAVFTVTA